LYSLDELEIHLMNTILWGWGKPKHRNY
jgi:hypothetical protein